jgi:hypothetical protein
VSVQVPEFRQVGEQRAAHHGAHARHTAQEILFRAPDWAVLNRVVEIAIHVRDTSLEPADVIRQTPPDRCARVFQPIPRRGQYIQQLPAPRHERSERLDDGFRERAGRGLHPFGKERQDVRIQAVGLGELPRGFGEVAHLPGIRDDEREPSGRQRGNQRPFRAPGRFQHDERRRQRL